MDRVTSEGRVGSAVNGLRVNGTAAGRVSTLRTPGTRRRWIRAASGMLAAALEAVGAAQRSFGRNPSGGNRLDGQLAARALGSGRTSRTHVYTAVGNRESCLLPPSLKPPGRCYPWILDPGGLWVTRLQVWLEKPLTHRQEQTLSTRTCPKMRMEQYDAAEPTRPTAQIGAVGPQLISPTTFAIGRGSWSKTDICATIETQ